MDGGDVKLLVAGPVGRWRDLWTQDGASLFGFILGGRDGGALAGCRA
jgi:hypothetical protein